jgi:hypothetical protein
MSYFYECAHVVSFLPCVIWWHLAWIMACQNRSHWAFLDSLLKILWQIKIFINYKSNICIWSICQSLLCICCLQIVSVTKSFQSSTKLILRPGDVAICGPTYRCWLWWCATFFHARHFVGGDADSEVSLGSVSAGYLLYLYHDTIS